MFLFFVQIIVVIIVIVIIIVVVVLVIFVSTSFTWAQCWNVFVFGTNHCHCHRHRRHHCRHCCQSLIGSVQIMEPDFNELNNPRIKINTLNKVIIMVLLSSFTSSSSSSLPASSIHYHHPSPFTEYSQDIRPHCQSHNLIHVYLFLLYLKFLHDNHCIIFITAGFRFWYYWRWQKRSFYALSIDQSSTIK